MVNKQAISLAVFLSLFISFSQAAVEKVHHPFYIGAGGGYGSTTWRGLVPTIENQNSALSVSTPIAVKEGGNVWSFFAGYEFIPYFAVEANYMRYPSAKISFDSLSLFSFSNNDLTKFTTRTDAYMIMGKVMFFVPRTYLRIYSSAGIANVHREDILIDHFRLSPTFGLGFDYPINDHLKGELGVNYTAGFGESQLNPADSYFPFLYSVSLRLSYHF